MKKGTEVTPDEEFRLRNEDLFEAGGPQFGSKGSGTSSLSTNISLTQEPVGGVGFEDYRDQEFREAS